MNSTLLPTITRFIESGRMLLGMTSDDVNSITKTRALQFILDNGYKVVVLGVKEVVSSILVKTVAIGNNIEVTSIHMQTHPRL